MLNSSKFEHGHGKCAIMEMDRGERSMDALQEKMEFLLNPEIPDKLRNEVNEDVRFSVETKHKLKGERTGKLYPAWNRICAIMDRIEDLVYHINGMEVSSAQDIQSAFTFFDLLNHGAVLIDCVNMIAQIYEIDLSDEDAEDTIFHNRGNDGKGDDKAYFEYLRSLCSVHPIETSRHRRYMDAEFECCPYVMWLDDYNRERAKADLEAWVYTNRTGLGSCKSIYISLSDVKAYIQRRYDLLENRIIDGIHQFKERKKNAYRKSTLKTEADFSDYVTYLRYIGKKSRERFGDSLESDFEHVFFFMCLSFSNWKNQRLLKRYQNALQYAVKFHHNALQNMSFNGFENNGIEYPDLREETTLLWQLIYLKAASDDVLRYQYELSTQWELRSEDSHYALGKIKCVVPALERYVSFDEANTPEDYFTLVQLALYQDNLEGDNLVNRNIPNEGAYRIHCLTKDEWNQLHAPEATGDRPAFNIEKIEEMLKKYGQ